MEEFDLSLAEYAIPAYYVIASAEASSNLSRFDGVKYGFRAGEYEGLHQMYKRSRSQGFGPEVKRRIMLGSFVLSAGYYDAYYLKALRTKALIKQAFDKAFARFDVILAIPILCHYTCVFCRQVTIVYHRVCIWVIFIRFPSILPGLPPYRFPAG